MFELTWFFLPQWETRLAAVSPVTPTSITSRWQMLGAAAILVTIPVFFQAPLVRWSPVLGLLLTGFWWLMAWAVQQRSPQQQWGSLLLGFSWSWLAGSIYWGWWRTEPLLHLPIEAIALPFALWSLWANRGRLGSAFYLGSLLGTAITDGYFYLTDLIPYWRQVMVATNEEIPFVLQAAVAQMQTVWGMAWAGILVLSLLWIGLRSLQNHSLAAWAFGGAVLSTLLVDGLFWGSVHLLI